MNKVILIGNLTRDPEARKAGEHDVIGFGMAINTRFSAEKEEVCFVDVEAWNQTGKFVSSYFKKGQTILVEGRLKLDRWESEGEKRQKLYVVAEKVSFVGKKDSSGEEEKPKTTAGKAVDKKTTAKPVGKPVGKAAAKPADDASDFDTDLGDLG